MALARYNTKGTLDTTFSGNGKACGCRRLDFASDQLRGTIRFLHEWAVPMRSKGTGFVSVQECFRSQRST